MGALGYAYDNNGNRTGLTATIGTLVLTTTFTHDDANRLDIVTDPAARAYDHGHDASGNRSSPGLREWHADGVHVQHLPFGPFGSPLEPEAESRDYVKTRSEPIGGRPPHAGSARLTQHNAPLHIVFSR